MRNNEVWSDSRTLKKRWTMMAKLLYKILSVPKQVIEFNRLKVLTNILDSTSQTRSEIAHMITALKKLKVKSNEICKTSKHGKLWKKMAKWRYTKINLKTRIKIAYASWQNVSISIVGTVVLADFNPFKTLKPVSLQLSFLLCVSSSFVRSIKVYPG